MRDSGFLIYKALVAAPEKPKEEKKDKAKKDDKKDKDKDDKKEEKKDEKDKDKDDKDKKDDEVCSLYVLKFVLAIFVLNGPLLDLLMQGQHWLIS